MSLETVERLFLEFQEKWSLERVKGMKLEEYTSTIKASGGERDDFTYWIESKLDSIGSIWGGSSYKFGIYLRDNLNSEVHSPYLTDKTHSWHKKYGDTADEAFETIKEYIIRVIISSQNNQLDQINTIDLGDSFKWKIAFHYQNIKNIKIVDIFSKEVLSKIAKCELGNKNLEISEIHSKLLDNKQYTLTEMMEEKVFPLWWRYGDIESEFKNYLSKETSLAQSSIKDYVSHIKTYKFFAIRDSKTFETKNKELQSDQNFIQKNQSGNEKYSNALRYYGEFLEYFYSKYFGDKYFKYKFGKTPHNQILYGPPGTGKTYHTINKALEIIALYDLTPPNEKNEILKILDELEQDSLNEEARKRAKDKFKEYQNEGQIEFVTFHQSYGYEEFVEGIKPDIKSQKDIVYRVKDGVLKRICKRARSKEVRMEKANQSGDKKLSINITDQTEVWKISLGDKNRGDTSKLREYCFKNGEIRIGWGKASIDQTKFLEYGKNDRSSISQFKEEMKIGDFVLVLEDKGNIKGVGIIESEMRQASKEESQIQDNGFSSEEFRSYRKVKWINTEETINILKFNNNVTLTQKTIYPLWRIDIKKILKFLPETQNLEEETLEDNTKKPHILIIDEINRGNVSKIFGELITLIEESKRIGAVEELKVTLPYSDEPFGVPKNLYIIGTMNTSDRSITALDTALRRRFEFVEMMPDSEKLSTNCEGINLQEMLKAINERIEFLLDREKTIGHTFFIDIYSIEDLKKVFQNKVIPLLQEYFYNDYACIQAVLNNNGMIQGDEKSVSDLFPNSKLEIENKTIHSIVLDSDEIWDNPQTYIDIYDKKQK